MTDARAAEEQFYSRYGWCLNPVLSVEDLFRRFREEIDSYEALSGWQREESKANLYLFACAIACTADDYFAVRWLNLKPLTSRLPKLRPAISAVQSAGDAVQSALKVRDRAAWQWRRRWDDCVSEVCRLLLAGNAREIKISGSLRTFTRDLCGAAFPQGLLKRRMRLPEAFRAQDMAHHDVITLIDRFCNSDKAAAARESGLVLMGLRTAGAYFAALMAEYLKQQGYPDVSWFSIRPKNGVTKWEGERLAEAARAGRELLVVDDYPSTGRTFRLTFEILRTFGVRPEQTSILAPTHPAQLKWVERAKIEAPVRVFTFPTSELYKVATMDPAKVEKLCREYFGSENNPRVLSDPAVDALNDKLAQHSKAGHHVREKRVFAVELQRAGGAASTRKLFFKSAGWGWLGYHAYIAGTRMSGFVPEVVGLRDGLVLMEWVGGGVPLGAEADESIARHLGRYVAARTRRLAVAGDCRWESRTYRWAGSDEIVSILRKAYGPYVNRLKVPALRNQLQRVITSVPTFVDGRMRPEEWLQTSGGILKVDFEHHNFGGGELDIVDPAWDLAAAIHEFRLSRDAERELLRTYAADSGDTTVENRLLIYKILYGTTATQYACDAMRAGRDVETNHERRQYSRSFLVHAMNEFCAQLVGSPKMSAWSPLLFFMDLDGVFDQELLGFPHASRCGLQSIALLRAHGFSIIPNTGRSIHDVRNYCETYGFPGGVAEYGSVFLDRVNGRELPLIAAAAGEQLAALRDAVQGIPGVFMDPAYEYSVRLYRYNGDATVGLKTDEIKELLSRPEFSKLTYVSRSADTYVVQKRTSKGAAVRSVRRIAGRPDVPVTAIGDSEHDIGMLAASDFAYAPANCSPLIRGLSKEGRCRIVKKRFQNGLLEAIQDRVRRGPVAAGSQPSPVKIGRPEQTGLMESLLAAADRGPVPQTLLALMWWSI